MMVVCEIIEKGESEASFTRDQSYNACEELDKYPFRQCTKLFHDVYRTHRDGGVATKGCDEKGFNPLRNASEARRMDLDQCTEGMVRTVFGIVHNSCKFTLPSCYQGENI
jgi:hypothetical protein